MRILFLLFCLISYTCAGQTNALVVGFDQETQSIFREANADTWFKKEVLISAFVGGALALIGSYVAHWLQVRKEERSERQFIRSVLLALKAEIKMLQGIYDAGIGKRLKETTPGKPLLWKLSFSQSHFTVYETNTALVGRFPPEVVNPIVKLYALMKVSIEDFHINNAYIEKFNSLKQHSHIGSEHALHEKLMVEHTDELRALDKAIHYIAVDVLALLEKYAPEVE